MSFYLFIFEFNYQNLKDGLMFACVICPGVQNCLSNVILNGLTVCFDIYLRNLFIISKLSFLSHRVLNEECRINLNVEVSYSLIRCEHYAHCIWYYFIALNVKYERMNRSSFRILQLSSYSMAARFHTIPSGYN